MQYEEPYYKRNPKKRTRQPRRRRQTLGAWLAGVLLRLFAFVLAVALLGGAVLYFLPVSLLAVEPEGVTLSPIPSFVRSSIYSSLFPSKHLKTTAMVYILNSPLFYSYGF